MIFFYDLCRLLTNNCYRPQNMGRYSKRANRIRNYSKEVISNSSGIRFPISRPVRSRSFFYICAPLSISKLFFINEMKDSVVMVKEITLLSSSTEWLAKVFRVILIAERPFRLGFLCNVPPKL